MDRPQHVDNVVFVTLDGVRTQEFFCGVDAQLYEPDLDDLQVEGDPTGQRSMLWKWLWGTFLKEHGVALGNRHHLTRPNTAKVANGHRFSYPGYSEMFTGKPQDAVINSNASVQNPYKTIFEFARESLDVHPAKIAAFASWAPIAKVAESKRGSVITNAGPHKYDPFDCDHEDHSMAASDRVRVDTINLLQKRATIQFEDMRYDCFTAELAMTHLKTYKPRLLFVGLGETDEWAHYNNYPLYLKTIQYADEFLRNLWTYLQTDPHYRGRTALIITTDHGRGDAPDEWIAHSKVHSGSEYVWIACGGVPGLELRGDFSDHMTDDSQDVMTYTEQIAATITSLLGLNWHSAKPDAAAPISQFLPTAAARNRS